MNTTILKRQSANVNGSGSSISAGFKTDASRITRATGARRLRVRDRDPEPGDVILSTGIRLIVVGVKPHIRLGEMPVCGLRDPDLRPVPGMAAADRDLYLPRRWWRRGGNGMSGNAIATRPASGL